MTEMAQVLEEAERLYDDEEYRAAHDLLWDAVQNIAPDKRAVIRLSMSLYRLEYTELYVLLRKYPDSLEVKTGVAEALVRSHHEWEAVDICTDILSTYSLLPKDEFNARWARFRAVAQLRLKTQSERYETLVEDFSVLWSFGDVRYGILWPYNRRMLISTLAGIQSPLAIPALQKLRRETWLPESIQKFLEQKVAELQALEKAIQEYDQPSSDSTSKL